MTAQLIRRARSEDLTLLSELGATTFRDAFASANRPRDIEHYVAEAFSEERTRAALEDPCCHFWIAYNRAGETIGYAKLREGGSLPTSVHGTPSVEIQRLYLTQEAIGTGAGSELMRTALVWARGREYDSVWLGVWEGNPRAIEFYRRWGFVPVGDQVFRLGTDNQTDLIMECSV